MKKVLVSLVTMTGLVFAQQAQPQPATLDSLLAAVENAARDASPGNDALKSAVPQDAASLDANNAKDAGKSSTVKTTSIVSGAAALGAVIGAAASKDNRAKGALIGAAVGGGLGYLIERMTREHDAKQTGQISGDKPAGEAVVKPAPVEAH